MHKCCIKNCKEICADINSNDLIRKANEEIISISEEYIRNLKYGFKSRPNNRFLINKLGLQIWVLENLEKFKDCLCLSDINTIRENLNLSINCNYDIDRFLEIDRINQKSWDEKNPRAVSREAWEKYVVEICDKLNLEISTVSKACDFVLEISSKNISCDFLAGLSVYSNDCKNNLEKKIYTKPECKLHYDKLVKEFPKCNLTLSKYTKLVNDCNVKPEIIKEGYNCNFKFDIENKCPVIISNNGVHNLCELNFNTVLHTVSCNLLTGSPNIDKFIKEYKK